MAQGAQHHAQVQAPGAPGLGQVHIQAGQADQGKGQRIVHQELHGMHEPAARHVAQKAVSSAQQHAGANAIGGGKQHQREHAGQRYGMGIYQVVR